MYVTLTATWLLCFNRAAVEHEGENQRTFFSVKYDLVLLKLLLCAINYHALFNLFFEATGRRQSYIVLLYYMWTEASSLLLLLPSQQSCHMRRSIWGMSSQLPYPWGSSATLKTSCWTRVMLSPLSHSTRVREACFNWVSWAGVKTPGFSYQNLNKKHRRKWRDDIYTSHTRYGRQQYAPFSWLGSD